MILFLLAAAVVAVLLLVVVVVVVLAPIRFEEQSVRGPSEEALTLQRHDSVHERRQDEADGHVARAADQRQHFRKILCVCVFV